MDTVMNRLSALDLKVRKLAQKMEYVKKENSALMEENVLLKKNLENRSSAATIISETSAPEEIVLAQDVEGFGQSENLKRQIDQYISEISACIELVKKL